MSEEHAGNCGLIQDLCKRVGTVEDSMTELQIQNASYLGEKKVLTYIIIALQFIIISGGAWIGTRQTDQSKEIKKVKSMTTFNQKILKGEITLNKDK